MTVLGFMWTLPNTTIGLLLGTFTFQLPRFGGGALIFDRAPRGLTWVMPRFQRTAMTLGYVILSAEPVAGSLLIHEREHIRQSRRWGPLFIPAYLLLAIAYGYNRHPFEIAARHAAGQA